MNHHQILQAVLNMLDAKRQEGRRRHEEALAKGYEPQEVEFWAGYVKAIDEVEQQIRERFGCPSQ